MNSRERVLAAAEGREVDRVPVVPELTYAAAGMVGKQVGELIDDGPGIAGAVMEAWRLVGYDGIYVGWESSFNAAARAFGSPMGSSPDGVPFVASPLVQGPADILSLRSPDPGSDQALAAKVEALRLVRESAGEGIPLFTYSPAPFTLAGLLCGIEPLMISLIRDKQFALDLVSVCEEYCRELALAEVKGRADIVVFADPSASASLISPEMFGEFALPALGRLVAAVTEAGAIPSVHICGQTLPILEAMASTGAAILEIDHLVDLDVAVDKVGDMVCLQGNVDPSSVVMCGDREAVRSASEACLSSGRKARGFILSTGCEVPVGTPVENLKEMVASARKEDSIR